MAIVKPSRDKKPNSRGGWIFLALVLLLYAGVALWDMEVVNLASHRFMGILRQVIPILFLVFGLLLVVNLVLNQQRIKKYFGQDSGIKGWLLALGSGAIASGPVYPWYALMGDLKQKGMRTALVTAFLYSRAIKLPLLPLMVHYFGGLYTAVLTFYIIGFAVLNGLLMEKLGHSPTHDNH